MIGRWLMVVLGALLVAACGGGSSDGSTTTTTTPALTNFTTVTIDGGPAALGTGADGYRAVNIPYVSVTLCAPGSTSNCQTIDHVLLDTGSEGLRLLAPVLNPALLAALPAQQDPQGNPVGECYTFVDNYVFGSVRQGDFAIGGEKVAGMPLQVIGDSGAFASEPASCSAGGGVDMNTVKLLGANGIIGVGLGATDCGSYCTTAGGSGAAIYYDCPDTGCNTTIARAASTSAPFQQLPNPVAAFATDNNGVALHLPSVPQGALSATGTIYFGIATQTNNGLGAASVLPTNKSGMVTALYNGQSLPNSFLDSGSNYLYFTDNAITACTQSGLTSFYCPSPSLQLSPEIHGYGTGAASAAFTLYNAVTQFTSSTSLANASGTGSTTAYFSALAGVGVNLSSAGLSSPISNSFDFGLPFFYGRTVFTAITGRKAGAYTGPFYAY